MFTFPIVKEVTHNTMLGLTIIRKGSDTFTRETMLSKFFCSLLKRGLLQKKKNAPSGSKLFSFRVDHFSEGIWWAVK